MKPERYTAFRIFAMSSMVYGSAAYASSELTSSHHENNTNVALIEDVKVPQNNLPEIIYIDFKSQEEENNIPDPELSVSNALKVEDVLSENKTESKVLQPNISSKTDFYISMDPCGGDLPPCKTKELESGGNYRALNPIGCEGRTCGGAWQFDPETWDGFGGFRYAQDAPPVMQDERARQIWNHGKGCQNWNACGE